MRVAGLLGSIYNSHLPKRENRGPEQQNVFPKVTQKCKLGSPAFSEGCLATHARHNLSINIFSHITHRMHVDKKAGSFCRAA